MGLGRWVVLDGIRELYEHLIYCACVADCYRPDCFIGKNLPHSAPLPLIQIAIGSLTALGGLQVGFDPDIFLLLFIPPLLFADAYRMPMREFGELRNVIIFLALGLVVFTTIGCGYFIHWLIPPIILPAAFALAAVLSPTDAVSVGSMIEGGKAPARVVHILHGEALLNDASGLVCFKFAVVAAMTGIFSFPARAGGIFHHVCWRRTDWVRSGLGGLPGGTSAAGARV